MFSDERFVNSIIIRRKAKEIGFRGGKARPARRTEIPYSQRHYRQ